MHTAPKRFLRAMGVKDPQDGSDIGFDGQRGGETNRGLEVLAEHIEGYEYDAAQHAASEENRRLAEEAAAAAIARAQAEEAARLAAEQAEAAQSLSDYFLDQALGTDAAADEPPVGPTIEAAEALEAGETAEAEPDLATRMMFDHLEELTQEPETPRVGPTIEAAEALAAEASIVSQPGDMIGTAEILAAEADAEAARLEVEEAEGAADEDVETLEGEDDAALDEPDSEAGVQFAGAQGAVQLFVIQDGVITTGHGAEFSALLTEHGSNGVEASLRDTLIKELGLDENFAFVQSEFDALMGTNRILGLG